MDSGVAADTSHHKFSIDVTASLVTFKIDDANTQTISTNIPSSLLQPRFDVVTKENADKRLVVDLFDLVAER